MTTHATDTSRTDKSSTATRTLPPLAAVRRIPLQRWLALMIVVLESVTVAYLSKTTFFPVFIICVAVFGTLSHVRFSMDRQRTYDIIALMAVVFVIKYMVTPDNPRYATLFPSQQMAFALAQYVLTMQCVQFYLQRRDDRLPFSFPGIGVIALVCAAMLSPSQSERTTIQALCVGFAILAVLFCDASRRFVRVEPERRFGRPIAIVLVLLAVGSLGWFTASSMFHYERDVEKFVNQFLDQGESTRVGFSESSTLSSISLKKDIDSKKTALRVVASVEPGYFRARAYDVYENQKWLLDTEGRALNPKTTTPAELRSSLHNGQPFLIADTAPGTSQRFEVWPDADLRDTFAGPLRTTWLYADAAIVTVDTHDIMRSSSAGSGVPYTLIVGSSDHSLSSSRFAGVRRTAEHGLVAAVDLEKLRTPPNWATSSQRIVDLTKTIIQDCNSVSDKVKAVEHYFHDNYSYSLTVSPPKMTSPQPDEPLIWFLTEQPSAHCEYFASGAAVLLRMAGVPCRYVVGFVISEQNEYSGEWVARNEDAHAWVEAYDESRGWITVDATPATGIPDDSRVSSWTQLYEYMRDEFHRLRVGWQQRGFASVGASLKALATSPLGTAVIAIATLCTGAILLSRRRRNSPVARTAYTAPSSDVAPLQNAREKLDRILGRVWRIRLPGETAANYARQLASAARDQHDPLAQTAVWYQQYAQLRFTQAPDRVLVSTIASKADRLAGELRRRGNTSAEDAKPTS